MGKGLSWSESFQLHCCHNNIVVLQSGLRCSFDLHIEPVGSCGAGIVDLQCDKEEIEFDFKHLIKSMVVGEKVLVERMVGDQ